MESTSTKQKLLSSIDDIEIISKEIFEILSTPKNQQKPDAADLPTLMELLIEKDKEIKSVIKIAGEQAEIQKTIDELKLEVDRRDHDIKSLQKNLKEAETILSSSIYQAKQKLNNIAQANNRAISSEELIKFAHRISSSNAVAAPPTWGPGDPRRPYPTDYEMRHGFLGKQSDLPMNNTSSHLQQPQGTYPMGDTSTLQRSTSHPEHSSSTHTPTSTGTLSWQPQPQSELSALLSSSSSTTQHSSIGDMKQNKENEKDEMSSDSSSSSSSDE